MYLISYVCADFRNPASGEVLLRITPATRGVLQSIPDETAKAISKDPLYRLLVADGSLKVTEDSREKRILEQDPMLHVDAEGRKKETAPAGETAPEAVKNKRTGREPLEGAANSKAGEENPGGEKPDAGKTAKAEKAAGKSS